MPSWLVDIAGPDFARAALWTLLALVVLVIVLVVIRIIRSMTFGTFVAGGRNRKTRLAVMDAAAVDSQRRLVLVRRDDVEHLILIGGPTDVVVERDIRQHAPARRPAEAPPAEPRPARPRPQEPAAQPRPEQPRPAPAAPVAAPAAQPPQRAPQPAYAAPPPVYAAPPVYSAPPPAPKPPAPQLKPVPARMPAATQATQPNFSTPRATPAPSMPASPRPEAGDFDRKTSHDFDFAPEPVQNKKPTPLTLEDEMNRLLGELSTKR